MHPLCRSLPHGLTALVLAAATLAQSAGAYAEERRAGADRHRNAARTYPHPRVVRLVLDLNSATPSGDAPNPGLTAIADLIRHYRALEDGGPQLDIFVVLHGASTDLALAHTVPGPGAGEGISASTLLMRKLGADGVRFVVSRRSLASHGIREDQVQGNIAIGPTASIIFLDLEAAGYIFDDAKGLGKD